MKKDYKGIAEEEVLATLCIYCIRRSLGIEDEATPLLFLGWGGYRKPLSLQPIRLKQLKTVLSTLDLITDKKAFLNNLMTDSGIDLELAVNVHQDNLLKNRLVSPEDFKSNSLIHDIINYYNTLNYDAILAMASNLSYYINDRAKEEGEFMRRNLGFVLFLDLDLDEIEEYTKYVLKSLNFEPIKRGHIQNGLYLLKEMYNTEDMKKYRREDEETKKYFKTLYYELFKEDN